MKNVFISSTALALALSAVTTSSQAGYVVPDSAYCSKDSTGSGSCYGTIRGFRNDSNPNTRIEFYLNHASLAGFYGSYGGTYYSCYFAPGVAAAQFAASAGSTNQFFYIAWDSTGTCTYGYRYQGSSE